MCGICMRQKIKKRNRKGKEKKRKADRETERSGRERNEEKCKKTT
jgi:hypothetical protein